MGVRAWGLQPPGSGKTIIFRAKDKFFGQKPAAKNEKNIFFVFIK